LTGKEGHAGPAGEEGPVGERGAAGKVGLKGVEGKEGEKGHAGEDLRKIPLGGHLIGTVLDASTGRGIADAEIFFVAPGAATASKRVTSLSSGRYYASVAVGKYTVRIIKDDYTPLELSLTMRKDQVSKLVVPLSRAIVEHGERRIVLQWSAPELRLESFLAVPGGCTVSAATADCHSGDGDGPAAVFEHERCAGCAPQTAKIEQPSAGKYVYFVRQASELGRLADSRAVVRIYSKGNVTTYRVSSDGQLLNPAGRGRVWCAFVIDGAKLMRGEPSAVSECGGKMPDAIGKLVNSSLARVAVVKAWHAHEELQLSRRAASPPDDLSLKPKKALQQHLAQVHLRPIISGSAAIHGEVVNVLTGRRMRAGVVTISDARTMRAIVTAVVNGTGDFRASLPFGLYTATVRAPHYVSPLATLKVDRSTFTTRLLVSPSVPRQQLRLVLTWEHSPKDLDSYLRTPDGCIVWYEHRTCGAPRQSSRAVLDVDNTIGRGPETTTITNALASLGGQGYCFYVKQYSAEGVLRASGATVHVFAPSGPVQQYTIGAASKLFGVDGRRGQVWAALRIVDGVVDDGAQCPDLEASLADARGR